MNTCTTEACHPAFQHFSRVTGKGLSHSNLEMPRTEPKNLHMQNRCYTMEQCFLSLRQKEVGQTKWSNPDMKTGKQRRNRNVALMVLFKGFFGLLLFVQERSSRSSLTAHKQGMMETATLYYSSQHLLIQHFLFLHIFLFRTNRHE